MALVLGVLAGALVAGLVLYTEARRQVEAWRSAPTSGAPTTVWSAPLRLRAGEPTSIADLASDLLAAGYERTATLTRVDQFTIEDGTIKVWAGAHTGPWGAIPEGKGSVRILNGAIAEVKPAAGLVLLPTALAVVGDLQTRRTLVRLSELSPWMVPALLAIEDARFRDHVGIDPFGILRAAIRDLSSGDLHGGSTLTQQLAKNLFLGQERTFRRKVREAFLAMAMESALDKDELLELYLSEVYLGNAQGMPVYGVEQAARTWFGRSASHLDISQAATIAGVIASPNQLSPQRSLDAALSRRDVVLRRMVEVRALTQEQADAALAQPLELVEAPLGASWRSPWVVQAALDAASDALGDNFHPDAGLNLYTSVQPHLQRAAETSLSGSMTELARSQPAARGAEAALAAISVADGAVLALVGGRDFRRSPFHRATDAWREAGSTVKPLVTLSALEANPTLHGASTLSDLPLTLVHDGVSWTPRNYDASYQGDVTLRRALEQSRNVPFVRLAEGLGWRAVQRTFLDAGLTRATDFPSASLGGFPTQVMELAGAYTTFPGKGIRHEPWLLRAVTDAAGRSQWKVDVETERLASARSTALVRHLLEGVITEGTAKRSAALGLRGAFGGKTGTTDNGRDAWFVGFDADIVTAVWVGLDKGTLGLTGGEAALPVWVDFQQAIGAPRGRFADPDDIVGVPVCAATDRPPCPGCAEVRTGWFPRNHVPALSCAEAPPPTVAAAPEAELDAEAEANPVAPPAPSSSPAPDPDRPPGPEDHP